MSFGNFEINTNINSVSDFNRVFQQNINDINKNIDSNDAFQDIFDSIQQSDKNASLKGGAEFFVGADAIDAQKVENLSESAKMARDFGRGIKNGLNSVSAAQKASQDAFETFSTGGNISIHEVMIASEKSSLSMQMAMQLRNQMVNAYTQLRDIRL
ncbi:flagellar hook-basal body complex protein FliE [Candidatus Gastranaerophilus sp. (ex Termes propinquus)]|nr:flagellar hook-basal body complex protein FliE [Candidatus Gastranaerophilus sp. (ex Termes propinquus)]